MQIFDCNSLLLKVVSDGTSFDKKYDLHKLLMRFCKILKDHFIL